MKYLVATLLLSQATAFTLVSQPRVPTAHFAKEYTTMEGEGKINLKVCQSSGT
jgi:hypothetical protein